MADPRPFPTFIPVGGLRVQIPLSTGQVVELSLDELQRPTDIVPVDHPDFEAFFAVFKWLRARGVSADQAFGDQQTIAAYFSATYTPIEVTA